MTYDDRPVSTECAAPRCEFRARTVVDGEPLCGHHARAAARKAAEAAREAAWWEKMFTPSPGQLWRADPEWQATQEEYVTDPPGENDSQALTRRIRAAYRMQEIEARYRTDDG